MVACAAVGLDLVFGFTLSFLQYGKLTKVSLLRIDSQAPNAVKGTRCGHAVKQKCKLNPGGQVAKFPVKPVQHLNLKR